MTIVHYSVEIFIPSSELGAGGWEIYHYPAEGLPLADCEEIAKDLQGNGISARVRVQHKHGKQGRLRLGMSYVLEHYYAEEEGQ